MNIVELLKRQHEEVKDLLERMIAEDEKKESRSLLTQLGRVVRLHMAIEEKMVYPAASRAFDGDEDDEETVLEAYEEHAVARHCLEALEGTSFNDKRFVVRVKIVRELLERHIEEEENDMFPELEGKLGREGIEKLGDQVERKLAQLEAEFEQESGSTRSRRPQRKRGARSSPAAKGTRTKRSAQGSRGTRSSSSTARTSRS